MVYWGPSNFSIILLTRPESGASNGGANGVGQGGPYCEQKAPFGPPGPPVLHLAYLRTHCTCARDSPDRLTSTAVGAHSAQLAQCHGTSTSCSL
jgi:hypothetical protein